jgi:hypothetical protein
MGVDIINNLGGPSIENTRDYQSKFVNQANYAPKSLFTQEKVRKVHFLQFTGLFNPDNIL